MYNKLEEIARDKMPQTPVLGCRITRTLEPKSVGEDVSNIIFILYENMFILRKEFILYLISLSIFI